ncbi:VOC family protein [Sphingopyxis sp.]|jgi:catechol 2,3-dioxygenase-like lactoylglutathione lyase family enzyme|uniref:VOC family protein n=1 Tax=Sphingopyxis sp. TaxID=1908224 RepID=UPI002DEF955E|nr:VOC family protein [Sphingopyxis sp.]
MANQRGLPGLKGTDHIGFTVPDLDEATHFFVEVLGCDLVCDLPPISDATGSWMHDQLNVDPRATCRIRLLRCGHGSNFEIFEYDAPAQRRDIPANSDVGGFHLAFYVDDFGVALDYLRGQQLRILGEPVLRESGPNAGQTWVYFLSPWGMQLELVSYPGGRGYETGSPVRLWHPGKPAD